jgi:hypothetical protein
MWTDGFIGLLCSVAALGAGAQTIESPNASPSFLRGDQYQYVLQAIDDARNGDASSKYHVWRVLAVCKRRARQFQGSSALEAKHALPAPYPHALQEVDDYYDLCGRFYVNGFREFPEVSAFRMEAANSGFPPAVVDVAIGDLITSHASVDDAASRIIGAINAGDPEALIVARQLQLVNVIDYNTSLAFALAACRFGYDCERNGPLMRELCWSTPSCSADDSLVSLVKRDLGESALRERLREAEEIRAEIVGGGIDPQRFHWHALDRQAVRRRGGLRPQELTR